MSRSHFPKITIVTPSYNQGQYLERTIKSVLDQNYPNLEYLIIDGGSTDNSVNIIKKYQSKLFYWHTRPDDGQYQAIQTGFDLSSGSIMGWLNSDDILLPNSLQLVGQFFSKYQQLNWLTSQSVLINDRDEIVHVGLNTAKVPLFLRLGFYHGKLLGFIPQEGTFWNRSLWQKSGGLIPHQHYALDFYLWQRFAKYSPLVTLEAPLAAFRLNPNRKTSSLHQYYREINRFLPYLPKYFAITGRILHPFLKYFFPRIKYDRINNCWQYYP